MAVDEIVTEPSLAATLEVSRDARNQAMELLTGLEEMLVKGGEALGPNSALTAEEQAELLKSQRIENAYLSQLRGLHRAANMHARETKMKTADARLEVDRLHLQLQNLYYEQRHLEGEISACESYDHKYRQLPLIPVEEFLELKPEHKDDDANDLMVARIDHERAEREALEQQRQELLKRKAKLIAENKKRKDDLAKLDTDLEKFIDAARPIQERFEKSV